MPDPYCLLPIPYCMMSFTREVLRVKALSLRLLPIAAALLIMSAGSVAADILSDGRIALEYTSLGTITSVRDLQGGIDLAVPPELAEIFRLTLRTAEKKDLTILGRDQDPPAISTPSSGLVEMQWDKPLRDTEGAAHDIPVSMTATLENGSLTFRLSLVNNTRHKVGSALYPFAPGMTGFGKDATVWGPTSGQWSKKLELPFGDAALAYPGQMNMSFVCVQGAKRSMYFSSQDEIARYKVYHLTEIERGGKKDVFAYIQHTPLTPPGGAFEGSPVVIRFVDGDWRAAGKVYREWFIKTFGVKGPEQSWIRRQSFFEFTMFMLPEGNINLKFKDIPQWGRDAKAAGMNAVQVSGWQLGGHDNGYPYYVPDPRLGTVEELREGIRACQKMGLKVYFFVNYQPMMVESDWYKNDLKQYLEMREDGGATWLAGWGMGTLWARTKGPKLMSWADLSFPAYRKIIVDQFADLARLGADGVHVDKMFPAAIEYNPNITVSPDTATWEGAIQLSKEIEAACKPINPNWAMSFECNWDRMLQFGGASWWVGNMAIVRQVFPENAETLGIANAYDYLGINNAIRGGHVIMLCPKNFSGSLGWAPWKGLCRYIKEVKGIRDRLASKVFYGAVLGHDEVKIARPAGSGIEYNVFRDVKTGKHACVITNSSMTAAKQPIDGFTESGGRVRVYVPFKKPVVVTLPAAIDVPGERIAFVEEL